MTKEQSGAASLYEALSEPASSTGDARETKLTEAKETIDNDPEALSYEQLMPHGR